MSHRTAILSPPSPAAVVLLDRVIENVFTQSHPEVIAATEAFREGACLETTFAFVNKHSQNFPEITAKHVAAGWLEFTETVPWLLCTLASNAEDNIARHFLIQTVFEELGGRNRSAIHCHLFADAVTACDTPLDEIRSLQKSHGPMKSIGVLREHGADANTNAAIMGLCLGLELPANGNISALLNSIGHEPNLRSTLLKTPFFQIHTVVEDEHIRLSVANYLHFCSTPEKKGEFHMGFCQGIRFWREFWSEVVTRSKE